MRQFISFILSLSLFVLFPFYLLAQEKEIVLEEIVVTATRDVQEIRKIPANVTVITKEEIERSSAQNTVDLLKDEVGVVVRNLLGTGKSASVDIRGFGETGPLNTLVLVDGRRVNEIDLSGVDWTQIPLEQIERIEVVRGPGSVLYGDNAVGGVINILTKKPEKPFSAKGEIIRGSYLYHKENGSVGGKWGPFSAILNADYSSTEGYRENGFLRYKDAGGKMIFDMNEDIHFDFSGNIHQDETGLPGALLPSPYKWDRRSARYPYDQAETEDGFGAFGIKAKLWEMGRIESNLSYRHREVLSHFPSFSFKSKTNVNTWGFTPKYILEKPIGSFRNKLTTGVDFYTSELDLFSESAYLGPNLSEVRKRSTGVYLLDEFSILPKLILSLGYRHEWVIYHLYQDLPSSKDRARDGEPAWNIGLDYLFAKRSSAFINIKRSFRFPTTDELIQYIIDPITWQITEVRANPDLKPQRGYHYEAGLRHAFTDQIEANLTFFWSDLRNEIFYNPLTGSNENYSKTQRRGIEAGTTIKPFSWITLWGNYSYIRPILKARPFLGNDIPCVPRHKGSLGGDFNFGKGFLFTTRLNVVGSRHFISDWSNQVERMDGYYSWDAKFAYSWKGFKAYLGVNNLTNRKYSEYGVLDYLNRPTYYPSPERNFFGGVSYTF